MEEYMNNPSDAFGKLTRDDTGAIRAWHPLIDHMTDVAACFLRLCRCSSIRRALERTARRKLHEQDLARLAVLVFLHDLGKASSGFQAKRWAKGMLPPWWPRPTGHSFEATLLFGDDAFTHLVEKLPIDALCTWGDAVEPLLNASISHHGRPVIEDARDWNRAIWKPVCDPQGRLMYDPAPVLQRIGRRVAALYPAAFGNSGDPLPDAPPFGHLFAGLVQLADWLGSDTRYFDYLQVDETRMETAPCFAERAVTALGLDIHTARADLLAAAPGFVHTFGNRPYPIQAAMETADLGPLVILESETGSGKTEAAIWRYLYLLRSGRVDSLYFALPTRVSATQVYTRVRAVVERLWSRGAPVTVRALPGYAGADGNEATALPGFQVLWSDRPDDAEAERRWAAESPKRFLAAPIAVGTVDQALLGALQVRHAHLRHALLSRSLLVVDEVHASDPYMTVLLEHLLRAHLGCGGHALLLSATLGSSARGRYLSLAPGAARPGASADPFQAACGAPYPAITDFGGMRAVASRSRDKAVSWSLTDAMDDPERIAEIALDAAAAGAKVLVIRNTVPAAIAVLKALEARAADPRWLFSINGLPTLHHSRFSRQDRPILDAAIEAQLGKARPAGAHIVVGTQTLEQSLDLDADLLITDLCPMDVLLQRIGRLHRHPRPANERPEAFRSAQVKVLVPPGNDLAPMLERPQHGLGRFREGGGVYADLRAVEATRRLVEQRPHIAIPADNRLLVEAATHPERLAAIEDDLGESWRRLGQGVEGDTGAQRAMGHLHALELHTPFDEQQKFPADLDVATRLGVRDRLLLFDPAPPGPFGAPLQALPVRHYLLPPGLDADAQPAHIQQGAGGVEFDLGSIRFRYGRLGLERLQDE